MNINPDYESDSQLDAELAMEMCMQGISDLLLQPAIKRDELSEEDQTLLGIIGMTLKTKRKWDLYTTNGYKISFRKAMDVITISNTNIW